MSNYDIERGPLPSCAGCVYGGPEIVNGTGQVRLEFLEREDGPEGFFTTLSAKEAFGLAEWIVKQAARAQYFKWRAQYHGG